MSVASKVPPGLRLGLACVAGAGIAVLIHAFGPWPSWGSSAADPDPAPTTVASLDPTADAPAASAAPEAVSQPTASVVPAPAANLSEPAMPQPVTAGGAAAQSSESEAVAAPEAEIAAAPAVEEPAAPVRITLRTVPAAQATVTWGTKELGTIRPGTPLVLERPRDSGPLDVTIRAKGYLPVNARAYTFAHNVVDVRITPRSKKSALYGYRVPLPPLPDAGTEAPSDL